jgi:hypothetical protein
MESLPPVWKRKTASFRRRRRTFTPDYVTPWIFVCDKPDGDKLVQRRLDIPPLHAEFFEVSPCDLQAAVSWPA